MAGAALTLANCGLFVPEKNLVSPDHIDNAKGMSSEGRYEDTLVRHVVCEIASGIWQSTKNPYFNVPWLKSHKWGTAVTLTITAEEQSGLSPGVSFINSLPAMQSFTFGVGATGSANATRTETIQFTYVNDTLWQYANNVYKDNGRKPLSCGQYQNGVMVEGDLKIPQFIYDKAAVASLGNDASAANGYPPFNTFTENLTFVASLGASITPTWKLTKISANSTGTFASATRTNTNQMVITIGPIGNYASANGPAQLGTAAQSQHNAQVQAGAISQQLSGSGL
jgi:hypothetical protein